MFDVVESGTNCHSCGALAGSANAFDCCLSMYMINPTSIAKPHAVQQLSVDLKRMNIDIAVITESWLNDRICDSDIGIEGYYIVRRDRNTLVKNGARRKGGGLCVYVRSGIVCTAFQPCASYIDSIELLWLRCEFLGAVYSIACCYHPPRPLYEDARIIEQLSVGIDFVLSNSSDSIVFVAGDFNSLNTDFLEADYGLCQIVNDPTHGNNCLDRVFTSRPDIYVATVFRSLIKTKHLAVLVHSSDTCLPIKRLIAPNRIVKHYDVRSQNIDKLRYCICNYDWSLFFASSDIQFVYQFFLITIDKLIEQCIPTRTVTMRPRDPDFITPAIKLLLRKRNRLRRGGKFIEADALATKLNVLIRDVRSRRLDKMADASSKQLWAEVKGQRVVGGSNNYLLEDVDAVNWHFASISFDDHYVPPCMVDCSDLLAAYVEPYTFTDYEVEPILQHLKSTAPGADGLNSWLFKKCSFELASVVAHIFSCSFNSGAVPDQWHSAVVSPVPKVPCPGSLSDYRPISVTPILSRLAEKIVVQKWLRPAMPKASIADQFAFRPTGSTTAALVFFMHHVTRLLETNSYVRCLMIDFSKAFDLVDHNILMNKLKSLRLPANIYNWINSFLSNRTQVVKGSTSTSKPLPINRGTIQGSGLGPTLYILMKSDLRALSLLFNILFKFADDTTLLVPETTDVSLADEFEHILQWATTNKMKINKSKTKEIVFKRPNLRHDILPCQIDGVDCVIEAKLLGVIFDDKLNFVSHVMELLKVCSQRLYLLKQLRHQGLPEKQLHIICCSIVISKLFYAANAWGGHLSAHLVGKLDAFLRKLHKFGFLQELRIFQFSLEQSDSVFLKKITEANHCANSFVPPLNPGILHLRNKGHQYCIPDCKYDVYKKSFVPRCLLKLLK